MCKIPEYSNLEEKKKYFKTYQPTSGKFTIDTKEEYDEFYESFSQEDRRDKEIIFRGVKEAKYKMYTSVQREFIQNPKLLKKEGGRYEQPVEFVMDEIKSLKDDKRFTTYYEALGIQVTDFLCLSFLQHYGAPTPFLDFTYNIDKALYFGTEGVKTSSSSKKRAISDYISVYWMESKKTGEICDIRPILQKACKDCLVLGAKHRIAISQQKMKKLFDSYSSNSSSNGFHAYKLFYLGVKKANGVRQSTVSRLIDEVLNVTNLNIIAQEGCFVYYDPTGAFYWDSEAHPNPFDSENYLKWNVSLEKYLEKVSSSSSLFHCANIHKSLVPYLIEKNRLKDICKETIFPDMKAIAKVAVPKV